MPSFEEELEELLKEKTVVKEEVKTKGKAGKCRLCNKEISLMSRSRRCNDCFWKEVRAQLKETNYEP